MPAEINASTAKPKRPARPRFWVGPLVAGACFALGYGITQRVVLIRSGLEQAEPQSFEARAFPGESLEALRFRHGETKALAADVAAKELKESNEAKKPKLAHDVEQRKAQKEVERIAAAAIQRERIQQAPVITPGSLEDMPPPSETTMFETEVPIGLLDLDPVLIEPSEIEARSVVDSVVVEPVPDATDLFFTPIEAPPAP